MPYLQLFIICYLFPAAELAAALLLALAFGTFAHYPRSARS